MVNRLFVYLFLLASAGLFPLLLTELGAKIPGNSTQAQGPATATQWAQATDKALLERENMAMRRQPGSRRGAGNRSILG